MKKVSVFVLIMFVVVSFSSCNSAKNINDVTDNQWKLTSLDGVKDVIMPDADSYTLNFDTSKNTVFGKANCNRYFSSYSISDDGTLKIQNPGSTMMMCINDNAEQAYLKMIERVNSFNVNKETLELLDENGALLATYSIFIVK